MPTVPINYPGLPTLLAEMAKKHCRTPDQEATLALRQYIAEGADTEHLPDDLVAKAYEAGGGKALRQVELPQDVYTPIVKLAQKHDRTEDGEVAWGILWYINKVRLVTERQGGERGESDRETANGKGIVPQASA